MLLFSSSKNRCFSPTFSVSSVFIFHNIKTFSCNRLRNKAALETRKREAYNEKGIVKRRPIAHTNGKRERILAKKELCFRWRKC
ncbi:hypothetical protein I656_01178 [Geobacillus sp. WSUCF1]|nr:hypothetical protein I656_01178 [Geobacillus sp. WSUCF1]